MASALTCFFFYLAVLPLSFDSISLPVSISKDMGLLKLTVDQVMCHNVSIGRIYGSYDTHGFNVTIAEPTNMSCYVYISLGNMGAGNISLDVVIPAGKSIIITTDSSKDCIVSNANLKTATIFPQISKLEQVEGNITKQIVDLMSQMMGPAIMDMLRTEYATVAAQLTNYTKLPLDPLPAYFPKYANINDLSIADLKTLINDFPQLLGVKFNADIPTQNSFSVNATSVDNIELQTKYGEFNAAADVSFSASVSFQNISCDKALLNCTMENGAQAYNIRAVNGPNDIPLINSFIAPLVSGFANGALNTSTAGVSIDNNYMSTVFKFVDAIAKKL